MEYKKFGNTIIARLDVGDEVMESLKNIVESEKIKLAQINGLGGTNDFTIAVRNHETKKYDPTDYKGRYEIANIHGNVTTLNGSPYLHVHMGCGNEKGEYRGGHLIRCVIGATAEIFITTYDGTIDRKADPQTGLNVFKFD
jgi:predicted DNA-binding protein with PD1-like motif